MDFITIQDNEGKKKRRKNKLERRWDDCISSGIYLPLFEKFGRYLAWIYYNEMFE